VSSEAIAASTTTIFATGAYVPDRAVPNEALTQFPASVLPLIREKTGIACRRYAADDQYTSDLGHLASRLCLERARVDATELDAILLATSSPDRVQPATATRIQELLGATRAFAFDVNSVCSGAVFALHMADALVRTGSAGRVLVVAAELYSRSYINPRDFSTCACLGDGAAAVLVGPGRPGSGILGSRLHTDGSGADLIQVPAGGTMLPSQRVERPQDVFFTMRGPEVQEFASTRGAEVIQELLSAHGLRCEDLAFVVPHQANITVLQSLARRLGIDFSKFVVTLDRYGNTAGASVLIAFDELIMSGRAKRGDLVALVVFGGGLSWGATLIRI
jgi:3-oxoacyl-[acyl-carrier-protein] synthase III